MLSTTIEIPVRFSEVDSLRVVWHGHYARYFEDGREAFGKQHQLGYLDVYGQGFALPLVDLELKYKRILEYGDSAVVETTFVSTPAAKIIFNYEIRSAKHGHIVCTGRSTQVFMSPASRELHITNPLFFEAWKKQRNLA